MFKTYNALENATHSQPRVTALLACQDNIMPASWHMPISKSPFRYAVAVREENYTHTLLEKYGSFTLNFLPFKYHETVAFMGRVHGDEVNKLVLSEFELDKKDKNKNLLLNEADFVYECTVCDTYQNGDHTIFIADVKAIHVNEVQSEEPIFFSGRGNYATVGETVSMDKKNI